MTRRIEKRLEALEADAEADGGSETITLRETTVGSQWPGSALEPGETETEVTEIEP